jgi:hypothetical protein
MGTTVGDVISKIEKYEELRGKISASFSECLENYFTSTDDFLNFVKSKLTYDDIIELQILVDNKIDMLKKVEVVEDGKIY